MPNATVSAGAATAPIVLTGADLTIADVEAVARHGAAAVLDPARPRADAGGARRHRGPGRRRRGRLRRDHRVRRPGHGLDPTGGRRAPPGEPPDEPRGGRGSGRSRARSSGRCCCSGPTPWRSATAAAGRCSSTACWPSSTPGIHPVVPEQGSLGASGDLAPLAHLALPLIGRGQVEFRGAVVPALIALREVGLEPLVLQAEGGARAPQRDPDDERHRGAAARRRRPAGPDRQRGRGDERRGAARHRRRVRRGLPAGATASRPDRGRRRAPPPAPRQRSAATPPRAGPQGPGPLLAALRAAGPRRGPRRAGPPPPGPRHRAELRDRQPARLPGRRRRRPGGARDRRRHGDQRRQLPRRADRAGARLRQAGARRARLDQRAADGAAGRRTAERRAAAVPGGLLGHRLRDDDLPVHGRRPRVGEQGAGPSGVGRFDPDQRQPGGPRVDGLDRRAARADRPRARRADPRHRAAGRAQALDLRLAMPEADGATPGAGVAEALARGPGAGPPPRRRSRARTGHRGGDARSSTTARSPTSPVGTPSGRRCRGRRASRRLRD